jgi:hypothetical protein
MRLIFLIFFSINILSEPWINISNSNYLEKINYLLKTCKGWNNSFISYPLSLGEINYSIEILKDKNINNTPCIKNIDLVNEYLRDKFIDSKESIFGFQSGSNDQYFQKKGKRYYSENNFYYSISDISSNFAYKFKIINFKKNNKNFFDESYISYKYKNHVFTAGRINRWWSPSENYSLILSNSARPALGIEFKNYLPINPERKIFDFMGYVNYEFFVNKLEKQREIPNTLLFGNRVTFNPSNHFKFSLIRLAQFGGKDRPKDASTILKMLVGNDNTSSTLSFDEQPGNQLAGLDFIYNPKLNKNLKIFGQMIGEDEAGYFPSRKLSLFGFGYDFNNLNPIRLNIEYIDTFSGIRNYSYNHSLYKSGLRYYGIPIGASIDADSEALKVSFITKFNNFNFDFSFSDIRLNKNNSQLNYWTKQSTDFNQYNFLIKYKYKKSYIDIIYTHTEKEFNSFSKNNLFLNISFKI